MKLGRAYFAARGLRRLLRGLLGGAPWRRPASRPWGRRRPSPPWPARKSNLPFCTIARMQSAPGKHFETCSSLAGMYVRSPTPSGFASASLPPIARPVGHLALDEHRPVVRAVRVRGAGEPGRELEVGEVSALGRVALDRREGRQRAFLHERGPLRVRQRAQHRHLGGALGDCETSDERHGGRERGRWRSVRRFSSSWPEILSESDENTTGFEPSKSRSTRPTIDRGRRSVNYPHRPTRRARVAAVAGFPSVIRRTPRSTSVVIGRTQTRIIVMRP